MKRLGFFILMALWVISNTHAQSLNPLKVAQYGHGKVDTPLAWSSDGTVLAMGGTRGVWIYDETDAEPKFLEVGSVTALVYHPDGRLAVSADMETTIYDADLQPMRKLEGHSAIWSPDGLRLGLFTDAAALVLDAETLEVLHRLPLPPLAEIKYRTGHLVFTGSPEIVTIDYQDLLLAGSDSPYYKPNVLLWDLATDITTPLDTYLGLEQSNVSISGVHGIAPDGVTLIGFFWQTLYFIDLKARTLTPVFEDKGSATYTAYSPNGRFLAYSNWKETTVRDLEKGSDLFTIPVGGQASFDPSGQRLAVSRGIYDSQTGEPLWAIDPQPTFSIGADGQTVFENSDTPRLLNALTGEVQAVLENIPAPILNSELSPNGRWLVTLHTDASVLLWDAHTGIQAVILGQALSRARQTPIAGIDFSPDSTQVVIGGVSDPLWDLTTLEQIPLPQDYAPHPYPFTMDNRIFLMGDMGGVYLWEPRSGTLIDIPLTVTSGFFTRLSLDATRIAYPQDQQIIVLDVGTAERLATIAMPSGFVSTYIEGFSADNGSLFYDVQLSNRAPSERHVWDIARGQPIPMGSAPIWFRATSDSLGAVVIDQEIALYPLDAVQSDPPFVSLSLPAEGYVDTLAFSPDGSHLLMGYSDGVVIVWKLE